MLPDGDGVTLQLGVWMFKAPTLEFGSIADWSRLPPIPRYTLPGGQHLIEPINVIWLDFIATDEAEAAARVGSFLTNSDGDGSGWFSEPGCHGDDYFGHFPADPRLWLPAYQATWADARCGVLTDADHGRVFPASRILSDRGRPAFVSMGAFSRERSVVPELHAYFFPAGFNLARDALDPRSTRNVEDGWQEALGPRLRLDNEVPLYANAAFTTELHDGARLFVAQLPAEDEWQFFDNHCAVAEVIGCASTRIRTTPRLDNGSQIGTSVEVWLRNLDGTHAVESTPWGSQIYGVIIERRGDMPPMAAAARSMGRSAGVTTHGAVGDLVEPGTCPGSDACREPWNLYLSPDVIALTGGAIHGCPVPPKPPSPFPLWSAGNWATCDSQGWNGWVIVSFDTDGVLRASQLTAPGWEMAVPLSQPSIFENGPRLTLRCTGVAGVSQPCTAR
jgi:hypothetical protein